MIEQKFQTWKNWRPSRWRPSAARDAKTKECTHYLFLTRPDGCRFVCKFCRMFEISNVKLYVFRDCFCGEIYWILRAVNLHTFFESTVRNLFSLIRIWTFSWRYSIATFRKIHQIPPEIFIYFDWHVFKNFLEAIAPFRKIHEISPEILI